MKANEFVKKFGWEEARKACSGVFSGEVVYKRENINIDDLKRLVESWELMKIHGLEQSKEIVANAPSDEHFYSWTLGNSGVRDKTVNIGKLRKAIQDVESCQFKSAFEDDRTDFVSDIRNHIAPTTVVIGDE